MKTTTRACIFAALVAACAACTPPPAATGSQPEPTVAAPVQPADPHMRFVDIDWRVVSSSAVAVGTHYRFGSDGSLRIEAAGSTPGLGRWRLDGGKLVMVEEGITYPTDILRLDPGHFTIRSHNPGAPVEIAMVRADAP